MTIVLVVVLLVATIGSGVAEKICIVGSGIGGASSAYFLRNYSAKPLEIEIYDKLDRVGGRLLQVQVGEDLFEAGGSIIANNNHHMVRFTELLGLTRNSDLGDDSFGIWNGTHIFFRTLQPGESYISRKELLEQWDQLYDEKIPVYDTVEGLLKAVNLYDRTQHTLEQDLVARGISWRLINELITVIVRINYGQNVSMHGLVGAVALAGSGDDLWKVKEGNCKVPEGLIKYTNSTLHLDEEVVSVRYVEGAYEVGLHSGGSRSCDAVIIATPLDEVNIAFTPSVDIPKRTLQHTYTTFVRGLINSEYFGSTSASDLPNLIGTLEDPGLEFSSISMLKSYSDIEKVYKIFSRSPLSDGDLDRLFRLRNQTIQLNWGAYPYYTAPEQFAPIILDGKHLYYINTFESAASAMEASAVAARNVARLLLSRLSSGILAHVVEVVDTEGAADL